MKPLYSLKEPFESSYHIFIMVVEKGYDILEVVYACIGLIIKGPEVLAQTAYDNILIYLPLREFTSTTSSSEICTRQSWSL